MHAMRSTPRLTVLVLAATLAALCVAAPAGAQYFGRNAVQWERQKFEVLKTQHFDVYYYPEGRLAAEQVGRMGERWYTRLSRILGHEMKERQPVILYASHPQFQQTNTLGGAPGEGTGGVTEAFKRRIVRPMLRAIGPRTNDAETVLKTVLHADAKALTKDWHAAIKEACLPVITGKKDPDAYGVALVTEKRQGGKLNVGPVLSPDGSR